MLHDAICIKHRQNSSKQLQLRTLATAELGMCLGGCTKAVFGADKGLYTDLETGNTGVWFIKTQVMMYARFCVLPEV